VVSVERFELRISEEDRARLRALAEQTSRTEAGVVRFLIRQATTPLFGDIPSQSVPPLAQRAEEATAAA